MNTSTRTLRCCTTAWLLVALACAATLRAADRKPNFLFVYTDDQRWDAMGVVQGEQGERETPVQGRGRRGLNLHPPCAIGWPGVPACA